MRHFLWMGLVGLLLTARATAAPWLSEPATDPLWVAVEDDNGGQYVLWCRRQAQEIHLMGQHFGSDGTAAWPHEGIALAVVQSTGDWTAFADARHGLVVGWTAGDKVVAQLFTPAGTPVWSSAHQVSDSSFTAASPIGVADGSGGFFMVWAEKRYADRSVLMAQHIDANAKELWVPEAIRVSARPSSQKRPTLCFDGAAGFIVAWADYRDLSSDWRAQRMNYQGFRLWGLEGIQVTAPAGPESSPLRVAPWRQGTVHFAWSGPEGGHTRIQELWMSPQGKPIPDKRRLSSPKGDQWHPVIAGNGEGSTWIGWEDNRNDRNWQVFVRALNADIALAPTGADQGRLAIADDGQGGLWTAWVENRQGTLSVFTQHVAANGQILGDKTGHPVAKDLGKKIQLQWVTSNAAHAALLWSSLSAKGLWTLEGQPVQ